MTVEKICKILDAHGVPYMVKGGRVLADSMIGGMALFEAVQDCTEWTRGELYGWLGY